jgi:hypothetical protein
MDAPAASRSEGDLGGSHAGPHERIRERGGIAHLVDDDDGDDAELMLERFIELLVHVESLLRVGRRSS